MLVHGILDGPDVWARVAPRLQAAGRRVILPTGDDASGWSPPAEGRALVALLSRLAPEGAHLVGHSRGATSASWVAVEAPELARSLAVVASPPQASEAFRGAFRRQLERATDPREASALRYLSTIPEDDFPAYALRRYTSPALVVEFEDDPLYAPTQTLFWRAFLPYASFERVPGGHRAFAESEERAEWLARRVLAHVRDAESR